MDDTILLVDVDPVRADLICGMLAANHISVKRCQDIHETKIAIDSEDRPAVIVVHCELVNYSFTELAFLRHHPKVKLVFYCTDPDERSGNVAKIPEDLAEIIRKITESSKVLWKNFGTA